MKTVKDIMELLGREQGKVFIMDAEGEIRLVLMGMQEYQSVKGQVLLKSPESSQHIDPEAVNRRILEAQLAEQTKGSDPAVWAEEAVRRAQFSPRQNPYPAGPAPTVQATPKHDLREEVIDPSFNFDSEEI